MICSECGKKITKNTAYCPYCGESVYSSTEAYSHYTSGSDVFSSGYTASYEKKTSGSKVLLFISVFLISAAVVLSIYIFIRFFYSSSSVADKGNSSTTVPPITKISKGSTATDDDENSDDTGSDTNATAASSSGTTKNNDAQSTTAVAGSTDTPYYIYNRLTPENQSIYNDVYAQLMQMKDDVRIEVPDMDTAKELYNMVLDDHPEIFYAGDHYNFSQTEGDSYVTVNPNYTMSPDERTDTLAQIESVADSCLSQIDTTGDDYSKVKEIYDFICDNTSYVTNATDNQRITSVFLYQESVCNGYASAFQYLCQRLGIECLLVSGMADNNTGSIEAHAWNLVKEDGDYYLVDVTWGDGMDSDSSTDDIDYSYLNLPDSLMNIDHSPELTEYDIFLEPCTSLDNNYFVRNNLYFSDYESARNQFIDIKPDETVCIMLDSDSLYQQTIYELIDNDDIYNCYSYQGSTRISYSNNDLRRVLSITRVQ